jgi:hypothetical protein
VTYPDELHRAIAGRDRHAFDVAFARTAAACNACHAAANKAYIEVPSTLGTEVPVIEHAAPTENPDAGGTFAPALR